MKPRHIFIVATGLTVFVLALFVMGVNQYVIEKEHERVKNHSRVISSAMWDFEPEGMTEYFKLACKAYNYKSVLITHSSGEIFIDINHSFNQPFDNFFIAANLFPLEIIVSDVNYNGRLVGQITVNWYNNVIYIYIYAFLVGILILTIFWFSFKTVSAKKELEIRVEERTTDLQSEIFERKQAEKDLEKYAQRLAVHLEQTPLGVIEWDLNFKVVQWNKSAEIIFGYSRDESIGRHAADLIIPGMAIEYVNQVWADLITKQGGTRSTNKNIRKDGEFITCDWYNTTLIDSEGVVIGVASLILDITEGEKAKTELQAQKSFIQEAIDAQSDTLFVFDPTTGQALQWNKAFRNISGYSDEEISLLKAPDGYYSKSDLDKAGKYIDQILDGQIGTVELELICKNGHRVPTEYVASVIRDANGRANTLIAIGRDMSERRAAEKEKESLENQLRQAHKMEAIGTLAGGIAHDFNNILAAIIGYAEMVNEELPQTSPAKRDIQEVMMAGKRAKELIRHILTFSRQETKERTPTAIHQVVKETLKLLRASIPTTIEIKQNIDPHCGNILADQTQIHQVLMNLCTNAAQAMDESGGVLELELTSEQLTEEFLTNGDILNPGDYVRLTIKDTGVGIEQHILDRIFDPYFTTKEIGKGTGMGLAVVSGIVKSHEGVITVDSKPWAGTTFTVYFPKIRQFIQQKFDDITSLPRGTEKILIIDDEKSIANMTGRRAEQLGYKVITETRSTKALEFFRSQPDAIDLVITDQTMPGLTGEQLARKLIETRADIPIILCTGYSSKMDAKKANSIGIRAFIMKPVDRKELATTIRHVLDNRIQPPIKNDGISVIS